MAKERRVGHRERDGEKESFISSMVYATRILVAQWMTDNTTYEYALLLYLIRGW